MPDIVQAKSAASLMTMENGNGNVSKPTPLPSLAYTFIPGIFRDTSKLVTQCWMLEQVQGVFTIELAKLGAIISVGDISPRQLEINSQKVQNAGFEHAVVKREVLDITDLSEYPSQMFDAVIAYGGPLSYVFDRADDAIDELLRVIKPRGHLLLSVMSLLGSTRKLLPGILSDVGQYGL